MVTIPAGEHHRHSENTTSSHPNATSHIADLKGTLGPPHRYHYSGAAAAADAAADAAITAVVSAVFVFMFLPSRCFPCGFPPNPLPSAPAG